MSEYAEELAYVESLSKQQRKLYFVNQYVQSEVWWLHFMAANDYPIADIRKQRELVQWEKMKLTKLLKTSTELRRFFEDLES